MRYRRLRRCAADWSSSRCGVHGRGGGRLKSGELFLSLLHVKVQESPPVLMLFHYGPCTFNFVYGLDFCYISFDLVQLGPSIEMN